MAISSTKFCSIEVLIGAALLPAAAAAQTPDSLQNTVLNAYRSGEKRVRIPPGTYRVSPPGNGPHLAFTDLENFTVDASGVELVFADPARGGIEFRNCRNVAFLGATLRYEIPPFTQGVVIASAPDGSWYDLRIDAGYPQNLDDPRYFPRAPVGYLFDPNTRHFRKGAYDLYEKSVERRAPGVFRIFRASTVQPVVPGDLLCFRGAGPHNVSVLDSAGMRFDDITIYNAPAFAVYESGGEGGNHYRFAVKPGPAPPNARRSPLFSSTADAFHSVNVRKGPVVEDCHFEAMADDGIAIHGTYSLVVEVSGKRLVVSKGALRAGDPVRLFDRMDRPAGEAVAVQVRPLEGYAVKRKSGRDTLADNAAGPYFEVLLSRPLKAEFDDLISDPAASGSGYIVRRNTILNHRARGMLLKAENGLVEGNTIDGSTMGGIVLTPEVWWNEAGPSRNVTIRNNVVRNVATAPGQAGGIVVTANDSKPVAGCVHQNIRIESNRFENIGGVNLRITSACGVIVRNNTIDGARMR